VLKRFQLFAGDAGEFRHTVERKSTVTHDRLELIFPVLASTAQVLLKLPVK
jgi:hypothetical protein